MSQTLRRPASRAVALLGVAALLPILIFAAVNAVRSLSHESAAIERDALTRVRELSDLVERELLAQLNLVNALSELPVFDAGTDRVTLEDVMRRIQRSQPLWLSATLADPQGNFIATTGTPAVGLVNDPDSLRRVIETRTPLVGNVVRGRQGVPAVPVRAPVIRGSEVLYVLSGVVRPDSLQKLIIESDLPSAWLATLIDAQGSIVARSWGGASVIGDRASERALAARAQGGTGLYEGRTLEGVETISAFFVSPLTGWSMHVGVPRDIYHAPVVRSLWLMGIGAAVCAMLAGAFASLLLREVHLRRRERQALEQAGRMEALGRLTGTVAHDFNNLLTVITGNLDMLQRRVSDPALERRVLLMRQAAERGARLTGELLAFSRGVTASARVTDINERVRSALGMLRQALPPAVSIELDLADDLQAVKLDPLQLDLGLLNLAMNARDAMEGGGTLTIRTRAVLLPDRSGRRGVAIAMEDTGTGIPEHALPHVFEPFFTTKEDGKGTGLGLTQVYGFAKNVGGSAEVTSTVGQGTVVTMYLPGTDERPEPAETTPSVEVAEPETLRRRILVVDDNDDVRGVMAEYLAECGYAVEQAPDAEQGLALLDRRQFDVVVSDVAMPGHMDGIGLARALRQRFPQLPVILISGYSAAAFDARAEGFTILNKPFDLGQLAQRIAETVGTAAAEQGNQA